MTQRFKVVPAVYLVVFSGENVLLAERKNTGFFDGWFGLISGHVDGNESMTAAIMRETREEAGVELRSNEIDMALVMHRKSDDRESVDFFYTLKDAGQHHFKNQEPEKCRRISYENVNLLPDMTIPFVREAIKAIRERRTYLEYGWH